MTISFNGFQETAATFKAGTVVGEGMPVKIAESFTADNCADADEFCGVALKARGGFVSVQMSGFVTLPYSGTAPSPGYNTLAADGAGGVKLAAGGRKLLVLETDALAGTVGVLL